MANFRALVVLITVLFCVTVNGLNVPFDLKIIMKCMEESNVADIATLKEILSDTTGSYPEENCLRKCLYFHIGVVHDDGEVDITAVEKVYQMRHSTLTEAITEKCHQEAEAQRADVCKFAMAGAHCFLNKVKFNFKM